MKYTMMIILLVGGITISVAQVSKPFVLGSVEELRSDILSEKRVLNIYFPDGYNENDSVRYPVIYLLDGSADEDFIHIAGLVQFSTFSWVNFLPKSILVGIANVDRRRDFTFPTTVAKDKKDYPTTGQSAMFISFIERELQPFIEKKFKVNAHKTIIGQSLGGLLATEILLTKPALFTSYIIVSPSLWWDKESILTTYTASFSPDPAKKPLVYIAFGDEGEMMTADVGRLKEILARKNIKAEVRPFKKENHGNILHQAVYNAFECCGAE